MSRLAIALVVAILAAAGSAIVLARGADEAPAAPAAGKVEYKAFITSRVYTGGSGADVYDCPTLTRVLNDIRKQGWRPDHIQRLENDQFVIVGARP